MSTADRTTIKDATTELITKLRANLVADPPAATAPLRSVQAGSGVGSEYSRPFLSVVLQRTRPIAVTDNDRMFEVTLSLVLFVDVTEADPHSALLNAIGATEDYLDSIVDSGVIEGAEGFDGRTWSFGYPKTTSGARLASATATETIIVKVERKQNRVPAS